MGDMADYFVSLGLDAGEGFSSAGKTFATSKRSQESWGSPVRSRTTVHCSICGEKRVHWRLFGGTYQLADNARQYPGNRYVVHQCATSADGFDEVSDAP